MLGILCFSDASPNALPSFMNRIHLLPRGSPSGFLPSMRTSASHPPHLSTHTRLARCLNPASPSPASPSPAGSIGGKEDHACQLERRVSLSAGRLLTALVGAWLFWSAGVLSESTPFRWVGWLAGFLRRAFPFSPCSSGGGVGI